MMNVVAPSSTPPAQIRTMSAGPVPSGVESGPPRHRLVKNSAIQESYGIPSCL